MLDLRLGKIYSDPDKAKELIKNIRENAGSCDEVWLATLYGFPKLMEHREHAQRLMTIRDCFLNNGIDVSLQYSNTLGHGQFHSATNDYSGLVYVGDNTERMVDANGTIADYCFCFYGENFRNYIEEVARIYAVLNPKCLWVDDDLRALNHFPVEHSCFCDNCIKRFNDKYNTSFTREELHREINYGDVIWRERYIEQNRQGFYELAAIITRATMEISPNTQMGYQYGRFFNYLGNDYEYVFKGMYDESKKTVKSRPGGGFYNDKNPSDMLIKAMEISSANSVLPEYVSHSCPEIESTPDVFFGKSLEGNCKEATLYLAYGCNGLTFAALNAGYETDKYNERLLKWLSIYRPYWDKLIEYGEGTHFGAMSVYLPEKSYMKPLKEDEEAFSWKKIIGVNKTGMIKIGMPLSCEQKGAKVFLLYPETVDYMTDDDIAELIKKPVVTDTRALKRLIERGFGKCFGADVREVKADSAREYFTNHSINKGYEGLSWKASLFVDFSWKGADLIADNDGKTEFIGEYRDIFGGHTYGYVNAIVNTYDTDATVQSKWAVFGYSLWEDIVSSAKRNQIQRAADYICGYTLPAYLSSPEQVAVVPRVNDKEETKCVTLMNISIGSTDELELIIRNPASENFTLTGIGKNEKLSYKKIKNDYVVKLPYLNPWEIVTVFC